MQTQCERLLSYLKHHNAINPMEAWTQLGIYRLGARVWDLRAKGHPISAGRQKVPNRFGEECHVATYRLERADPVPEGMLL